MVAKGEASEFNAIIQAEREKKKNQLLADKIFGSGKRSSLQGPGNGNGRKAPTGPATLASRAGITKPTGSKPNATRYPTSFKQLEKGGRSNSQQRSVSTPQLDRRNQILTNAITGGGNAAHNLRNQVRPESPAYATMKMGQRSLGGINIRGMGETSSIYTIIAQNFATGTTAADIESVLAPDPVEDGLIHCRLVASNPTVIAELAFSKLSTANTIIATFNNKKADGRLLHVYLQNPTPDARRGRAAPTSAPIPVKSSDADMMDVEETRAYEDRRRTQEKGYTPPRGGRAQPAIQDGRYGFSANAPSSEASYQDDRRQPQYGRRGGARSGNDRGNDRHGGGLVSDAMLAPGDTDRYVPQYHRGGRNFRS